MLGMSGSEKGSGGDGANSPAAAAAEGGVGPCVRGWWRSLCGGITKCGLKGFKDGIGRRVCG